jgi:L-fuculose-phosphate aldolase
MDRELQKEQIAEVARAAYAKDLTAGWGGNISVRCGEDAFLITPHKKSLAFVRPDDVLTIDRDGEVIEGKGRPSVESKMHLALYRAQAVGAVVHLHPPCLNTLIDNGMPLELSTLESKLTLGGTPPVVEQTTPVVTDIEPLVEAFRTSSIVCLKNHGTVAAGDNLFEALALTDVAEEAAKMTIYASIIGEGRSPVQDDADNGEATAVRLPVFSDEHMARMQMLVNGDEEAQRLGQETDLTVQYAIKQAEDGKVYNMHFEEGRIVEITDDEDADFVNVGKKEIWIHVFNGRLDPFAATSQKRLRLVKGHIGDLAKWYAPFYRIFALWKDAPVRELDDE